MNKNKEEAMKKLKQLIQNNDIWFSDGAGFHYLKNVKIVDDKIIIAQGKIKDFI